MFLVTLKCVVISDIIPFGFPRHVTNLLNANKNCSDVMSSIGYIWENVWDGPLWSNRRCMSTIISLVRMSFLGKTIGLIEWPSMSAFCHLHCYDNAILMNIRIQATLLEFFCKASFFDQKLFLLNHFNHFPSFWISSHSRLLELLIFNF